jgi:pyruvate dehydrogenase E1 component
VRDGLRRMYAGGPNGTGEDIFYYLTIYNEPIVQPAEPENADVEGILRGMHLYSPALGVEGRPRAQVLASGVAMPWALRAQRLLGEEWGVDADVWSVTSWNELRRDAVSCEEANLLDPSDTPRVPYVAARLADTSGPVVTVSDFMRAVPDQISRWVPTDYSSLGTDGFGFADTRGAARRFFHVDAESIVLAALTALAKRGEVKPEAPREAIDQYQLLDVTAAGVGPVGGDA